LGLEEMEHDPRFVDSQKRAENVSDAVRALDDIFATKSREEWLKLFDERGVGFAYAPLNEFADIATDPQILANDYVIDYEHPVVGKVKLVNFPVQFTKTPAQVKSEAPECGQHTEEILLEFGYSWEEIAELKDQEVI
jgi:crotonobetainyl-CoA:carnitine CoA-transferase CaiB-like acyl-CoA transferase